MTKKTIIDILQELQEASPDGLTFQMLSQCMDGQQKALSKPPGTRFTFVTSETLIDVTFGKRDAVLVWVDKAELVKRINAAKWEDKLDDGS